MKRRLLAIIVALACMLVPLAAFGASPNAALQGADISSVTLEPQATRIDVSITYPYADDDADGANDYTLEVYETSTYYKFAYLTPKETTEPADGSITATYSVSKDESCGYRVSHAQGADAVTFGDFVELSGTEVSATVTPEDLSVGNGFDKDTVIRDFSANPHDIGDIYLNAGPSGCVSLSVGEEFALYPMRNWQPILATVGSEIMQPDFHVEVVAIEGTSPVTAQEVMANGTGKHSWKLKGVSKGVALVKVTYDALSYKSGYGGPTHSAVWPENTGLLVVAVGASSGVQADFTLNADRNDAYEQSMADSASAAAIYGAPAKNAGNALDAELDVLYYAGDSGASYTFAAESGAQVSVARGSVVDGELQIATFSQDDVVSNADGSTTVSGLKTGKHVIKVEKNGNVAYQIVRAKQVNYKVYAGEDTTDNAKLVCDSSTGANNAYTNGTTAISRTAYESLSESSKVEYAPLLGQGSVATVVFDTLYHPATKLCGFYNMTAAISMTGSDGLIFEPTVNPYGGPGQYTFSSSPSCQKLEVALPNTLENNFYELNGALLATGYGYGGYGSHRLVSYDTGRPVEGMAPLYAAYFGQLPQITLDVAGVEGGTTPGGGDEPGGGDDPVDPVVDPNTPQQEADEFAQLVASIGTVDLDDQDNIWRARCCYDALSAAAANLVNVKDVEALEKAESQLEALQLIRFKPVSIPDGCVRVVIENRTWSTFAGAPWDGTLLDANVAIDMESDTIRSLIEKALLQGGFSEPTGTKNYISGIEGISEKENGSYSGWMFTLNDWFINEGANAFEAKAGEVRPGDEIHVAYSSDGGPDLGSSPKVTSKSLARLLTDTGSLSPAFAGGTDSYTLTLPSGSTSVHLRPLAKNRNFQARTYLDNVDTMQLGYRPNDAISVKDGSVITVVSGDDYWPSMTSSGFDPSIYTITVKIESASDSGSSGSSAKPDDGSSSGSVKPPKTDDEAAKAAAAKKKAEADKKAASGASTKIANLPAVSNVTDANAKAVKAARAAYNKLTADQKKLVPAATLKKLKAAEAAVASTITLNTAKVTKASVTKALKKAGKKAKAIKKVVLGAKVKKVGKASLANLKKAKTLVVKTKKLKKTSVKGALSKSKVTTVKVAIGKAKVNKSYVKKYKKIFTKKNAGKKAAVKA